jgi:hypothetical protein
MALLRNVAGIPKPKVGFIADDMERTIDMDGGGGGGPAYYPPYVETLVLEPANPSGAQVDIFTPPESPVQILPPAEAGQVQVTEQPNEAAVRTPVDWLALAGLGGVVVTALVGGKRDAPWLLVGCAMLLWRLNKGTADNNSVNISPVMR